MRDSPCQLKKLLIENSPFVVYTASRLLRDELLLSTFEIRVMPRIRPSSSEYWINDRALSVGRSVVETSIATPLTRVLLAALRNSTIVTWTLPLEPRTRGSSVKPFSSVAPYVS